MRDYEDITRRIDALAGPGVTVADFGSVDGLPMRYVTVAATTSDRPSVLLTGGVHGDEPAGIEAALRFLEDRIAGYAQSFAFVVVPCVNPTGYVRETRDNGAGADINRAFDGDETPESIGLKALLHERKFACAVDFHEDWETQGFYMYEGGRDTGGVGARIIERVAQIGPIDADSDPDDPPITPGVYPVSSSWGTVGLAPYLLAYHAPHVIISETPSAAWDIERRVAAHLAALEVTLATHAHSRQTGNRPR
ncbi:M14 family metallocarboxypeptidase [Candidatus Poribacteria bacterium]|nr:M14 family metallocarboxypeptidase [Candidatus Poribacteria bacterium]MBT5531933.1 M14 family metallocarboxypeptidase [Candidatus Poribacteria bacterium]MBT5712575.1 M14 family metallocarboxypeptidase [Candidatus Poribacteria bacterium]MBT7098868.1 M14 family metallocarboxypeptidase [Candidatus Poribacteria bacterium]MBT7804526.1 M14 family metallocarboxypeptidase [Candidatus Poribacteria bacterium]